MKPVVAIVGRPNVGKSTLFNRLLGWSKAIATDEPGVTRDLNFADIEAGKRAFTLVDTGGFERAPDEALAKKVKEQLFVAIEEADLIVFLMDLRCGPLPDDKDLVKILRRSGKSVIYVVNKVDSLSLESSLTEFHALGIPALLPVSAEHGHGVYELQGEILNALPETEVLSGSDDRIKVAIVGRPNVGKSSILNRLIGKERSIVSDMPGTTRDAIDTAFEKDGKKYLFIDTAGIRKKNRISMKVETYSVMEAIKTIERSDVTLMVIDAAQGVETQDEKILGLVERRKRCVVVVVNKWDIVEKDTYTTKRFEEGFRAKAPFISYAPLIFVSALTGQRAAKIFDIIDMVYEEAHTKVSTSLLNSTLEDIKQRTRPPLYKDKEVKLYYATQTSVMPPVFTVFSNFPEGVTYSYRRHVVNELRERLGLKNIPLKVEYRKRK
ncbi:MAG: ribosome biogenesis GTPase Der [Deltaproteobacteria bacterium]|nr:ribosome biogenesis GTPase Der [Deltaproteobacteria bacterium]